MKQKETVLKWQMDKALNIIKARETIDYFKESLEPDFIRKSDAMKAIFNLIVKIAPSDSTVLITGESGTGKEVVANAIRNLSLRNGAYFQTINCANYPKDLIGSELFGHEKGAFTGAIRNKDGLFEIASGGTLFLDEIGELPLDSQASLLRVIEEKKLMKVGGTKEIIIDVRLIAATKDDLESRVKESSFREDLFYRLNEFPIRLPPLRERLEDITPLINHFFLNLRKSPGVPYGDCVKRISTGVYEALNKYTWVNVIDLRNSHWKPPLGDFQSG